MKFYSLHNPRHKVTFREAVINGIAPDKGLYFPESIRPLPKEFFDNISSLSNNEIAFEAIKQFVGDEIPSDILKEIVEETLPFDFPLVHIYENISTLELFHGPTKAFKDVGAKFMAKCLEYFLRDSDEKVTVLVATSGDTGGAVANGFLGVDGVEVVILYPSGKVSEIQEKQLTSLGKNISALEVDGVFDDCQDMVKNAFLDHDISRFLTSANSINVARWLPQMFYYFFAYKQATDKNKELVFSVPSGNFGNICAGIMASKLGLSVTKFVASTNVNSTVSNYLSTGKYEPKPSKATLSNAMDVGNPSNFIRILELFQKNDSALKELFASYSFSDDETKEAMLKIYKDTKYVADPHGAVGYLGLNKLNLKPNQLGVFLETAHPLKFLDVVEDVIQTPVEIPEDIKDLLLKEKMSVKIDSYQQLKDYLNG